jgi:Pyrimidine dimer DNA glycosylase
MQTFLPSKDFDVSANMLDSKRLNKQILETYQILKVLSSNDPKAGWRNHPAVKMWRGFEHALFVYALAMVKEADKRGIKTDKNMDNLINLRVANIANWGHGFPQWYQNSSELKRVTTTHRARLFVKDRYFYNAFEVSYYDNNNKPCCEGCNYYWPTHKEKKAA